ncbi:EscS/YscS/HrcS family type III secretion system export apparatus protein [Mesorhizobium camelthorni]|nr:EscS/YscS/HrcS family type III secretion system export apparatus protein [Mesorhizobium alhagi]NGO54253.1 EscS/YscS/HrcS family type III secretion system export apparatus protein [Mesorhizobium camelthorni]
MTQSSIVTLMSQSLVVFMIWILPPLIASVIVGLVIGIIQAATQIQDESLPLTVKLLVVVAVIGLFAPVLSAPLIGLADQIFTEFPAMTPSY